MHFRPAFISGARSGCRLPARNALTANKARHRNTLHYSAPAIVFIPSEVKILNASRSESQTHLCSAFYAVVVPRSHAPEALIQLKNVRPQRPAAEHFSRLGPRANTGDDAVACLCACLFVTPDTENSCRANFDSTSAGQHRGMGRGGGGHM